ncbi:MAG TPA: hypothetical protein VK249_09190, partial [Anaerolineales bacterium]|nr:hypothetical protein [Anaerolineales bacterium]
VGLKITESSQNHYDTLEHLSQLKLMSVSIMRERETSSHQIEHASTNFHLVIATCPDPPLPLARFRARSEMMELRQSDLTFTSQEAADFLHHKGAENFRGGYDVLQSTCSRR